jgi:hypothetical protein
MSAAQPAHSLPIEDLTTITARMLVASPPCHAFSCSCQASEACRDAVLDNCPLSRERSRAIQ